jgi:pyridinium-3,5-bisthiocarboxylic acid mononucleotide nickel chelatase
VTRIAYLDCVGGVAGDMLVGALLDAGAPREAIDELPQRLALGSVEVTVERVERQGVGGLHVTFTPEHEHTHRDWKTIRGLLEGAELVDRVRTRALSAFTRLAEAEAAVHGIEVDDVHFHELGAVDTLLDICGAIALVDALGVVEVTCSPLPVARGHVEAAHGILPVPAPATLALLRGAVLQGVDGSAELVTPTGAALVAELASSFGELPPIVLDRVGVGAGSRELPDRANVVRVLLGETAAQGRTSEVSVLEANLDDLNPELVPDAMAACFAAGALDVWTVPVTMKKGRPGIVFSALVMRPAEREVARAMLEHTSTLGVRVAHLRRYELDREQQVVAVEGGSVRVKIARMDGRVVNVAPEHGDCAAIAAATGRTTQAVWAEALAAAAGR